MKIYTGQEGMSQFTETLTNWILETRIKNSKFNKSQKENLKRLLNSELEQDRVILKELLNVK